MASFFIEKQLDVLAEKQGTSASSLKSRIRQVVPELRLATACSGTESPGVLAKYWGLEAVFSCEFDALKQKWILQNFPETQRLFGDIKTLKRQERCIFVGTGKEVLNIVTGNKEAVPPADIFITGFVCKSVSTENNGRKAYKNCIMEKTGQTGETFSGMMDYVRKHRPAVVIAENVRGITTRNDGEEPVIYQVEEAMKRANYHFGWRLLNTSDFLIPQSRNRCWMVGLRRDQYTSDDLQDVWEMVLQMSQKSMSLNKYFEHFKVGRAGKAPNPLPNPRQKKVIQAGLKKSAAKRTVRDQVIIDVAKSDQRAPVQLNRTPCLVANSQMWWKNQERFLSAEEVLALQGIFAKDFKAAKKTFLTEHRRLCHDLTGNAFSMSVCSAVMNAVLLKMAER